MKLLSLASAFPPQVLSQADCWDVLRRSPAAGALRPRSRALLERILTTDSGIDTRHFFLPEPQRIFERDAGELNRLFEDQAPALAAQALSAALARANVDASQLDALLVCTCTGYLCPGVSSHVAERLGLRADAYLLDLVGQGCGAAIPMLRAAHGILAAQPGARIATVAVEICSAAFYVDDDPGVLVSLCLFGDGAAAALWSDAPGDGWRADDFRTLHAPDAREAIRFVNAGGKLKNRLKRNVPALAADAVGRLLDASGARAESVLSHGGGRMVLDALEARLGGELVESRAVMRRRGNVSSPSVLLALEERLLRGTDEGELWLTSFGAGFAAHSCRLSRGG